MPATTKGAQVLDLIRPFRFFYVSRDSDDVRKAIVAGRIVVGIEGIGSVGTASFSHTAFIATERCGDVIAPGTVFGSLESRNFSDPKLLPNHGEPHWLALNSCPARRNSSPPARSRPHHLI